MEIWTYWGISTFSATMRLKHNDRMLWCYMKLQKNAKSLMQRSLARIHEKERKSKNWKYGDLKREVATLWGMKNVIFFLIGPLGAVSKNVHKWIEKKTWKSGIICNNENIEEDSCELKNIFMTLKFLVICSNLLSRHKPSFHVTWDCIYINNNNDNDYEHNNGIKNKILLG